jgi:acetyltransferase-like isoleucine patch superfamily enzyme
MRYNIKSLIIRVRDYYLKQVKWRKFNIGKNFHASRGVSLWANEKIIIGDHCSLGGGTRINCNVAFGKYVFTANNVAFIGKYDHYYQEVGKPILFSSKIKDKDYKWKGLHEITIVEDDVWFGYGCIILSGVKIGKGSIIAAGSVVTHDVSCYSIYAGVPAKKIAERFLTESDKIKHIEIVNIKYGI